MRQSAAYKACGVIGGVTSLCGAGAGGVGLGRGGWPLVRPSCSCTASAGVGLWRGGSGCGCGIRSGRCCCLLGLWASAAGPAVGSRILGSFGVSWEELAASWCVVSVSDCDGWRARLLGGGLVCSQSENTLWCCCAGMLHA